MKLHIEMDMTGGGNGASGGLSVKWKTGWLAFHSSHTRSPAVMSNSRMKPQLYFAKRIMEPNRNGARSQLANMHFSVTTALKSVLFKQTTIYLLKRRQSSAVPFFVLPVYPPLKCVLFI